MITRARPAVIALALALGAAALIVLVLVTSARVPDTYPWGDTATTSIFAMRAARGELATGAYSRFHWNHPGPLLYQLLAPLYRLSGYHEISLKWSVLALNLSALAALLFVVVRRAPLLAIAIAGTLSPLLYREQRLLFWAWNPIVPLVPFALLLSLGAAIAAGETPLLPWFVAVATFIVQAHVGFTPLVATVAVAAVAPNLWAMASTARGPASAAAAATSTPWRRSILWSLAVLAILWAVPVVHDLRARPGNLMSLARFFLDGVNDAHPWADVLVIAANQLVGPFDPRWELTTSAASTVRSWPVIAAASAQLVLLVVVIIRARRRRLTFELAFASICFATSIVGVLATHAIAGPISDYLVMWLAILGALNSAAIVAWAGGEAAQLMSVSELPRGRHVAIARLVLVVYVLVVGGLGATRLVGKQRADARSVIVRDLAADLQRYCEAERIDRPVLGFSWPAWQIATGIALQFYKEHRPIALSDDYVYLAGDRFRTTGQETGQFFLMAQDEADLPPGVARHVWLATLGSFRLVRIFPEVR